MSGIAALDRRRTHWRTSRRQRRSTPGLESASLRAHLIALANAVSTDRSPRSARSCTFSVMNHRALIAVVLLVLAGWFACPVPAPAQTAGASLLVQGLAGSRAELRGTGP